MADENEIAQVGVDDLPDHVVDLLGVGDAFVDSDPVTEDRRRDGRMAQALQVPDDRLQMFTGVPGAMDEDEADHEVFP